MQYVIFSAVHATRTKTPRKPAADTNKQKLFNPIVPLPNKIKLKLHILMYVVDYVAQKRGMWVRGCSCTVRTVRDTTRATMVRVRYE